MDADKTDDAVGPGRVERGAALDGLQQLSELREGGSWVEKGRTE